MLCLLLYLLVYFSFLNFAYVFFLFCFLFDLIRHQVFSFLLVNYVLHMNFHYDKEKLYHRFETLILKRKRIMMDFFLDERSPNENRNKLFLNSSLKVQKGVPGRFTKARSQFNSICSAFQLEKYT